MSHFVSKYHKNSNAQISSLCRWQKNRNLCPTIRRYITWCCPISALEVQNYLYDFQWSFVLTVIKSDIIHQLLHTGCFISSFGFFSSLKFQWLLKLPFIKLSMLFLIRVTSNNWNISSQNGLLYFFVTIFKRLGIWCASSLGVSRVTLFHSKWSRFSSSSSVLGAFFRCLVIDTLDAEKKTCTTNLAGTNMLRS